MKQANVDKQSLRREGFSANINLSKGNVMGTTEIQSMTQTKLNRIAWLSKQDPTKEYECLMHLFNKESLLECFHSLDKNKAVGIDGIDKSQYAENLDANIEDLLTRMKKMAYRPGPVREVLIPKEGKPGATRPLGISNLEDKIIQKMMQRVLESIYEPIFQECSYGFRPGLGCHDAIKGLQNHLYNHNIQTIIDLDLKNFFGTINHQLMEEILGRKIKDPKLMRYISRMFKAGVLGKDDLKISEEGVPQGSICSPILANIFAHYALDLWIKEELLPNSKGRVQLFRYADDAVICCQYEEDAQMVREILPKRLEQFKLQLNEEKTKMVEFDKMKATKGIIQGTFDFLGFTFYFGKSRAGKIIPKLKTRAKSMNTKLKRVRDWFKQNKNKMSLKEIWKIFCSKLRGHIQYYGVSHNIKSVGNFLYEATKIAYKWLNRRSQRKSFTWEKFELFIKRFPLPEVKIVHRLF
jgi:group II intron reverse transcriptase/maturase